jgi:hypothetical protein
MLTPAAIIAAVGTPGTRNAGTAVRADSSRTTTRAIAAGVRPGHAKITKMMPIKPTPASVSAIVIGGC